MSRLLTAVESYRGQTSSDLNSGGGLCHRGRRRMAGTTVERQSGQPVTGQRLWPRRRVPEAGDVTPGVVFTLAGRGKAGAHMAMHAPVQAVASACRALAAGGMDSQVCAHRTNLRYVNRVHGRLSVHGGAGHLGDRPGPDPLSVASAY